MSGYAWTATRVCSKCLREFSADIHIVAIARVVLWRHEPTHCQECRFQIWLTEATLSSQKGSHD